MKITFGKIASAASVAGLAAMVLAGPAAAATPRLDLCQKAIELAANKHQAAVIKNLTYCLDQYRGQAVKGVTGAALATTAAKCNGKLVGALLFPDGSSKSSAQKTYNSLTGPNGVIAKGKCDNDMLQNLGHLREDAAGDEWAKIAVARAFLQGFNQAVGNVRDFTNAMNDLWLSDAGVSCPQCTQFLKGSPCAEHGCCLGGASGSCVDASTLDIPLTLTGTTVLNVCDMPNLSAGTYLVVGLQSKGLNPVDLGGGTVACVQTAGSEGFINRCSGGLATQNTEICYDHVVGGADTQATNECSPGFTCTPNLPDLECSTPLGDQLHNPGCTLAHSGTTNGGACLKLTAGGTTPGGALVANASQINVIFSGQEGTDGVPCTDDDTGIPAQVASIPLTTGTAKAEVYDADNTASAGASPTLPNGPSCANPAIVTGNTFDCSTIESSVLTGGKLTGAFGALHGLFGPPRVDTVTTFTLECN